MPNAVTDDVVWDCVTCGACVRECPVSIEHVDHIVDLRRHLVMIESRFPPRPSRCCATSSAPATRGARRRPSARTGPSGSACACSSRATRRRRSSTGSAARRRSTSAPAPRPSRRRELLQAAGVDFAILGPRESCTGDPARRMGNEYLFQAHAEQNVSTLNEAGVTKIVASCPHCFNTLGNEYPDFGGDYEVVHHTRAARRPRRATAACSVERQRQGRSPTTTRATWPGTTTCSQGPRELVAAVGQPVEMERSGKRTFCCGAGGAHMWMEERARADQRGARARGGRDRRRDARGGLPVLHGDARRRREGERRRDARRGRLDAAAESLRTAVEQQLGLGQLRAALAQRSRCGASAPFGPPR